MKTLLPLLALALLSACTPDDTPQEKAAPVAAVAPPDPAVVARQGLNDFLAASAPPVQRFRVPAGRAARVRGQNGTSVWVPAHAFATADGTAVKGPVDVELRECYGLANMVLHGMATRAGKRLLATGGMVYLAARTPDGRACVLRPGVALALLFPSVVPESGMRLFKGQGPASQGPAQWELLPPARATIVPPLLLAGPRHLSIRTLEDPGTLEEYRWRWGCPKEEGFSREVAAFATAPPQPLSAAEQAAERAAGRADSLAEVSGYLFASMQLSWLNCDKFEDRPATSLLTYTVLTDNAPVQLSLVFKNFRGLLQGDPQGGQVVFPGVPTGERATLVAVRWVAGQVELATRPVTLDARPAPVLVFHPVTRAQLLAELQKLDPTNLWETPGSMPTLPRYPCGMRL